jgi:hypothetical protein
VPPAGGWTRPRMLADMLRPVRAAVISAALAAGLATGLTGCTGDAPAAAPTPATATPLGAFATGGITVARGAFCSRVAPAAVEEALRAAPDSTNSWVNGERAALAPGVKDVAHEYGCAWRAADGTAARAWVFAPPITPGQATGLQRAAAREQGCEPVADAPRFGTRTIAVRCGGDGTPTTAFHGLFGDAWLSCSLAGAAGPDAVDRTGRWCVTVVKAAAA